MIGSELTVSGLIGQYRKGTLRPTEVIREVYRRISSHGRHPIWISIVPEEEALRRADELERDSHAVSLPLYGVPFAVKDNMDVNGMPTTAACPEFARTPAKSATVIGRLMSAGAILVGKTNMDQFATGLVGVRSPCGACSSVFDERYISGGSSSGSAVAVAKKLVAFSLGTDTAGSGRVPAAFNALVGLKPTRGLISTAGIVPACRSLDCVSVFAHTCQDAEAVWNAALGWDDQDPYSRVPDEGAEAAPWLAGSEFRFGVPRADQLEFFGDEEASRLFGEAIDTLRKRGGQQIEIDFGPFSETAALLYAGPWVSERLAAVEDFLTSHGEQMHPVVRQIIAGGAKYSAVDVFRGEYKLMALRQLVELQWEKMDVLLLPTTGTIYTVDEVEADPVRLNSNLGFYTNFVNLLDLSAVAVPAGFRGNGLPFGVSLIGPAFHDRALLALGKRFLNEPATSADMRAPDCIEVAVVGAHLTGQPLNRELTSRGARLVQTTRTAPGYRLYALQNTTPPKPGLVRDPSFPGPGIEVEVWSIPEQTFGTFVAGVPAPLGIGTASLSDGTDVKCFICEPYAVAGSADITSFGGWRKYLESKAAAKA